MNTFIIIQDTYFSNENNFILFKITSCGATSVISLVCRIFENELYEFHRTETGTWKRKYRE